MTHPITRLAELELSLIRVCIVEVVNDNYPLPDDKTSGMLFKIRILITGGFLLHCKQTNIFEDGTLPDTSFTKNNFKCQLLKWIGNKQKQAPDIIKYFPSNFNTYFEPFLGAGGVLGTLSPPKAIASDIFPPLMEIWETLSSNKEILKFWYDKRYDLIGKVGKKTAYDQTLAAYNTNPNGADLIFILRTCYGGVVRFRKNDGYMSTPCGIRKALPLRTT